MKLTLPLFAACTLLSVTIGCDVESSSSKSTASRIASIPNPRWLGFPSAISQVVDFVHEGTGWLLNKSQVAVKKVSDVRTNTIEQDQVVADFQITVRLGDESFETTATDVPCDKDGIPTEHSIERLRTSVEDIKSKMKRLQQ